MVLNGTNFGCLSSITIELHLAFQNPEGVLHAYSVLVLLYSPFSTTVAWEFNWDTEYPQLLYTVNCYLLWIVSFISDSIVSTV